MELKKFDDPLAQSVSNAVAGGVSFPIDAITWALRKTGIADIQKPMLGSDWMAEKGLTAPVKQGANQVIGDTLGGLMPGPGLAAKAMLLAAPLTGSRGLYVADQLRRGSRSPTEIWKDLGVEQVPTAKGTDFADNWVREISDAQMGLNKDHFKLVNDGLIPKPGQYKLGDILEHPELYKARPSYKDLDVKVDPFLESYGAFDHNKNAIELGTSAFLNSGKDPASTILHELMHKEQYRYKMPYGTGSSALRFAPEDIERIRGFQKQMQQGVLGDPGEAEHLFNILRYADNPYMLYNKSLGEQQARAVQNRLELSDTTRAVLPPSESYDDLPKAIDAGYAYELMHALRAKRGSP